MCTFLLKMREYYRWENELPFARELPRDELGDWLSAREARWSEIEAEDFAPLPLASGALDPLAADRANRELLPQGLVYSAGYGRFAKPVFFLGKLERVEERAGLTVLVSSCEYARELAAPPAMLQGRTIFVRRESVRRYLWEKIEEWQWRRQSPAMARALADYDFIADTEGALARMTDNEMESMILQGCSVRQIRQRLDSRIPGRLQEIQCPPQEGSETPHRKSRRPAPQPHALDAKTLRKGRPGLLLRPHPSTPRHPRRKTRKAEKPAASRTAPDPIARPPPRKPRPDQTGRGVPLITRATPIQSWCFIPQRLYSTHESAIQIRLPNRRSPGGVGPLPVRACRH
jgi:hypothetical protein